jgi:hypothetical protein
MSNPANFNSAPKCPRIFAHAKPPESEDLVITLHEAPVIAPVPTSGPEQNISLFSGESGSTFPNPVRPGTFREDQYQASLSGAYRRSNLLLNNDRSSHSSLNLLV